MHGNFAGVVFSLLLIAAGYVLHELIRQYDEEIARKVLHIWVSNWYFIYLFVFTSWIPAVCGLVALAGVNYYLEKHRYHSQRYGTVYYPLSIALLIFVQFKTRGAIYALGCAMLSMGYGDGLAAVVGTKVKSPRMPFTISKSVLGSLTMFVVTSLVILVLAKCSISSAVLIGFIVALVEAYMPLGLDNISVPLIVYLLVVTLC